MPRGRKKTARISDGEESRGWHANFLVNSSAGSRIGEMGFKPPPHNEGL